MRKLSNNYIKRPLAVGVLFYIVGLIGGELHRDFMRLSLFFIGIITIGVLVSIFYNNLYMGIYLLITCLGVASIIFNPVLKEERIFSAKADQEIVFTGKVKEAKEYKYDDQYVVKPKGSPFLENIKVRVKKGAKAKVGDVVKVKGKVDPLSFPRNPGSFNERNYLLIRGVTTQVKADTLIVDSKNAQTPIFEKVRSYYSQMFETIMPWKEAQIMKAMLLGDKLLLPKETQALYRDVGIAHVLAISGLHISVIAGFLWWLFKKVRLSKKLQSILVLLILWAYGALTGFSVSITRAIIMMSVIIVGTLIEEKPDPVTSWSFAALILLLYNNLYLWDIGFQLSFGAVGSIILLTPFFRRLFRVPEKIRTYIAPTLAVTLGLTPFIAYYYYVLTPIGIIINLLLLPLITVVVVVGFIAMLIAPIHMLLAKAVISSAYYLLTIIEAISTFGLKVPFSTLIVGRPDVMELGIYIVLIALVLWYLHLTLEARKRAKAYLVSCGVLLALMFALKKTMPGDLEVTFLDVGQGDSIVITTPHHKTFLLDGGIAGNGRKIEGFLKYKGIRKVDGAILSHAHADHMDGLGELAQCYKVDKLFLSEIPLHDKHFKAFYDIIQKEEIPIYKLREQDFIKDRDVAMTCLFPFKDLLPLEGNDASLVLVLKYGQVSYYLTGDIEENYEKEVAKHIEKNLINILNVAHHGSKTSSTQEFIEAVDPDVAIISCGKNNLHGHPSLEVVERFEENNVPIRVTKDVGAIMTSSNKETVKMHLMEDRKLLWK